MNRAMEAKHVKSAAVEADPFVRDVLAKAARSLRPRQRKDDAGISGTVTMIHATNGVATLIEVREVRYTWQTFAEARSWRYDGADAFDREWTLQPDGVGFHAPPEPASPVDPVPPSVVTFHFDGCPACQRPLTGPHADDCSFMAWVKAGKPMGPPVEVPVEAVPRDAVPFIPSRADIGAPPAASVYDDQLCDEMLALLRDPPRDAKMCWCADHAGRCVEVGCGCWGCRVAALLARIDAAAKG